MVLWSYIDILSHLTATLYTFCFERLSSIKISSRDHINRLKERQCDPQLPTTFCWYSKRDWFQLLGSRKPATAFNRNSSANMFEVHLVAIKFDRNSWHTSAICYRNKNFIYIKHLM